jgi:hypothetical protein
MVVFLVFFRLGARLHVRLDLHGVISGRYARRTRRLWFVMSVPDLMPLLTRRLWFPLSAPELTFVLIFMAVAFLTRKAQKPVSSSHASRKSDERTGV